VKRMVLITAKSIFSKLNRRSIKIQEKSTQQEDTPVVDDDQSTDDYASDGSEYGVKPPKKTKIKKRVNQPPWKYDPTLPSLTNLPYEVLRYHLLPRLVTASVYRLFTTCKLFFEMIGYPSLADHLRWTWTLCASHFGECSTCVKGTKKIGSMLYPSSSRSRINRVMPHVTPATNGMRIGAGNGGWRSVITVLQITLSGMQLSSLYILSVPMISYKNGN
jgi:hypothetical protein